MTTTLYHHRTLQHLHAAPALAAYIVEQIPNRGGSSSGPRVSGSGDQHPVPLNLTAVQDANDLYSLLVGWCVSHALELKTAPPASTLGWFRKDENCDGLPSWATAFDTRHLVLALVTWLADALPYVEELPAAEVFHAEVDASIRTLAGRYRMVDRPVSMATRTCDVCDKRAVIVDFAEPIEDTTVGCGHCGYVYDEQRHAAAYERYTAEVAIQRLAEVPGVRFLSVVDAAKRIDRTTREVDRLIFDGLPVYRLVGRKRYVSETQLLAAFRRRTMRNPTRRAAM